MSYIEREKTLEFVLNNTPHINGETTMKCVARAIKEVPTADVVEVVRCKDCVDKHTYNGSLRCRITGRLTFEDSYCSRGERIEK